MGQSSSSSRSSQTTGGSSAKLPSVLSQLGLNLTEAAQFTQVCESTITYRACEIESKSNSLQIFFYCYDCSSFSSSDALLLVQCEGCFNQSPQCHKGHRFYALSRKQMEQNNHHCMCGAARKESLYSCSAHQHKLPLIGSSEIAESSHLTVIPLTLRTRLDAGILKHFDFTQREKHGNNSKDAKKMSSAIKFLLDFTSFGFLPSLLVIQALLLQTAEGNSRTYFDVIHENFLAIFSATNPSATLIYSLTTLLHRLNFHEVFEAKKSALLIAIPDRQEESLQGSSFLSMLYTGTSKTSCFLDSEFIKATRKAIIKIMDEFCTGNANDKTAVQKDTVQLRQLRARLSWLLEDSLSLTTTDSLIDVSVELFNGVLGVLDALCYSRSHCFFSAEEITEHLNLDITALNFFLKFLRLIASNKEKTSKLFTFVIKQCKKRSENEHRSHEILSREISQVELWPLFSLPYRMLTVMLLMQFTSTTSRTSNSCEVATLAVGELLASSQVPSNLFDNILSGLAKETSAAYLFFRNRHKEPDAVTEFFQMFIYNNETYARICFDLSLFYRNPKNNLGDIDVVGAQLAILLASDKKAVVRGICEGMGIPSLLEVKQYQAYLQDSGEHVKMREVILLEFITQLISNEVAISNVIFTTFKETKIAACSFGLRLALINAFNFSSVMTVSQLAEIIALEVNEEALAMEGVVEKLLAADIFEFDKKAGALRLKEKFRELHDVGMLYKQLERQGKFYALVREKQEKDVVYDCVAGNILDVIDEPGKFFKDTTGDTMKFSKAVTVELSKAINLSLFLESKAGEISLHRIGAPYQHELVKNFIWLVYVILKRDDNAKVERFAQSLAFRKLLERFSSDAELKNCIAKIVKVTTEKLKNQLQPQIGGGDQLEQERLKKQAAATKAVKAMSTQQRMLEEIQRKQNGFVSRNREALSQVEGARDDNERILQCEICQQQSGELIILNCYLQTDNLSSSPSFSSSSSSSSSFFLTGCSHSFHGRCFTNQIRQTARQAPKNVLSSDLSKRERERFCCQCKQLSNTALLYLSPIFNCIAIDKGRQLAAENVDDLGQVVKRLSREAQIDHHPRSITHHLKQFKLQDTNFQTHLHSALIFFTANFSGLASEISEGTDIEAVLASAFASSIEIAFLSGLPEFLDKQFTITQAIVQNLAFVSCIRGDSSAGARRRSVESSLKCVASIECFGSTIAKRKKASQAITTFDDIWRELVAALILLLNHNQDELKATLVICAEAYINSLKTFLMFCAFMEINLHVLMITSMEQLISQFFVISSSSSSLGEDVVETASEWLLPYVRVVASSFISIFEVSDLQRVVSQIENVKSDAVAEVNYLLSMMNLQCSFSAEKSLTMITEAVGSLTISEFAQFFSTIVTPKYKLASLEGNFLDFHKKFYKPCYLCNRYSAKSQLVLCLLCEKVMCAAGCDDVKEEGNCCLHALSFHDGRAMMLVILSSELLLIDFKKSILQRAQLFENHFGQQFIPTIHSRWKDFYPNKKKLDSILSTLTSRRIPQNIRSLLWSQESTVSFVESSL